MSDDCTHETVRDIGEASVRTYWSRSDEGDYTPGETSVLYEENNEYDCVDCGVRLSPIGDGRDFEAIE